MITYLLSCEIQKIKLGTQKMTKYWENEKHQKEPSNHGAECNNLLKQNTADLLPKMKSLHRGVSNLVRADRSCICKVVE